MTYTRLAWSAALCFVLSALQLPGPVRAALLHPEAPRLFNYYLDDAWLGHEQALARWDLVVVDYKHLDLHPQSLALLRQYNPDIRILAYIDPMAINDWIAGGPGNLRYDFQAGVDSLWIAYTATGDTISYWEGTYHLNITERCPQVGGRRYRDYFVDFLAMRLAPYISNGTIDGIFLDEMSEGSYLWWDPLFEGCFDYDLSHTCDAPDSLAAWLNHAIGFLAEGTASALPAGSLVMANNCKPYQPAINGKLFERFPASWEGGLAGTLNAIDFWTANGPQPRISAVNGVPPTFGDLRQFRYRYAASLLADCYFNYDYDTGDHHQDEWFELFDFALGLPRGPRYTLGETITFSADFEDGPDDGVLAVPYMSTCVITEKPTLVLAGERSLLCDVFSSDPWPAVAELRPPGGFAGGEYYTIGFLYRVLNCLPAGGSLLLKAQYSGGCAAVNSPLLPVLPGSTGYFRASLTLPACDDFRVFLRACGDMTVVIDSLTVVEGRGGLLARNYEHGLVICNDSEVPQPLAYDADWELVDGDGQREAYPLWAAGQGITLGHPEGLVFHYVATAAEPPPAPPLRLEAFPNPFNPKTSIRFTASRSGRARLEIFAVSGRRVAVLVDGPIDAGAQTFTWDGRDGRGQTLPSGLYLCRLRLGEAAGTARLLLIR